MNQSINDQSRDPVLIINNAINSKIIDEPQSQKYSSNTNKAEDLDSLNKLYQSEKVSDDKFSKNNSKFNSKVSQERKQNTSLRSNRDSIFNDLNKDSASQPIMLVIQKKIKSNKKNSIIDYDSKTPTEVIYRNISNMTMSNLDFNGDKIITNEVLLSEKDPNFVSLQNKVDNKMESDLPPHIFKKIKLDDLKNEQVEYTSVNDQKDQKKNSSSKKLSKMDLDQKMRESLQSAKEISDQSLIANISKTESQELFSSFSEGTNENYSNAERNQNKRKTTAKVEFKKKNFNNRMSAQINLKERKTAKKQFKYIGGKKSVVNENDIKHSIPKEEIEQKSDFEIEPETSKKIKEPEQKKSVSAVQNDSEFSKLIIEFSDSKAKVKDSEINISSVSKKSKRSIKMSQSRLSEQNKKKQRNSYYEKYIAEN